MEEIRKDIKGYKGLYSVSNFGNVIRHRWWDNKKLKLQNCLGYSVVSLFKNGRSKKYYIHRLVSETFLRKRGEKMEVNHKNGIKNDNRVENLERCTRSENIQHSFDKLGRVMKGYGKKIRQKQINGEFIKDWESLSEAGRYLGIDYKGISKCCNGKIKSSGGYRREFI